MDDVLDMSLDDYINSFKESKKEKNTNRNEESKFKEGRREQNDDDADIDDVLNLQSQEDDYVSLALNDSDLTLEEVTEPNDLRNKIVGRLPQSSQQWRLIQPNIMNVRPAGMPPLVPSDAPQNSLSGKKSYWRNYNHKHRRNNWNNNNNFNNFNHYNNYNRNNNNNNNNGRIQRFNNNSRNNLNSKNIKIVLEQLKERNPMILHSSVGAPDLTIQATTSNFPNSNGFSKFTIPTTLQSSKTESVKMETGENSQSKGSEAIQSLLGVSAMAIKNDMMPALAGRLLDFLNGTNSTMHKPIYDMKIQKEIHEIQKKPLLYKCPGGEVVSSDGAGIPDCKIQPKVSGISLNNRFA